MSAFALSGGPYMMFVGGEVDMTDQVRAVNRLRRDRDELDGTGRDHATAFVTAPEIFTVGHHRPDGTLRSVALVNLADHEVRTRTTQALRANGPHLPDLLDAGTPVDTREPITFRPYQARFLTTAEADTRS